MLGFKIKGFGRRKDYNDPRDYTPDHQQIQLMRKFVEQENKGKLKGLTAKQLSKDFVSNLQWISGITNQGNLGSCVPSQVTSLFEYMNKKAYGSKGGFTEGSRLQLYMNTRFLMGEEGIGDSGAYIRTCFGAARMFGIVPEEYWPYTDDPQLFDQPPTGYKATLISSMAKEWKTTKQIRLDYSTDGKQNIERIKEYLAKGYAMTFGMNVFESYTQTNSNEGMFPYPSRGERIVGGHALNIIGYDVNAEIKNKLDGSSTVGAFLVQNSWGDEWGADGIGKVPLKYFETNANGHAQADDVWYIAKLDWLSTGEFFW